MSAGELPRMSLVCGIEGRDDSGRIVRTTINAVFEAGELETAMPWKTVSPVVYSTLVFPHLDGVFLAQLDVDGVECIQAPNPVPVAVFSPLAHIPPLDLPAGREFRMRLTRQSVSGIAL